jgi:hypothetical protein
LTGRKLGSDAASYGSDPPGGPVRLALATLALASAFLWLSMPEPLSPYVESYAERCLRADALYCAGRLEEAEVIYRDLVAEGYVAAKVGLAGVLFARGEIVEAKTCMEDALPNEEARREIAAWCWVTAHE